MHDTEQAISGVIYAGGDAARQGGSDQPPDSIIIVAGGAAAPIKHRRQPVVAIVAVINLLVIGIDKLGAVAYVVIGVHYLAAQDRQRQQAFALVYSMYLLQHLVKNCHNDRASYQDQHPAIQC